MPNSKLDVSKQLLRRKEDVGPLSDGEALLSSADLISQGFAGEQGIIDRQLLENLGFTAEMTREEIKELVGVLSVPGVISSPKYIQLDINERLRAFKGKKITCLLLKSGQQSDLYNQFIEYLRDYCLNTTFHDRQ